MTAHLCLLRAAFREPSNTDEDTPLSVVIGTRRGALVTILFALTQTEERGKGLLRALLATFMAEECKPSDHVVVLSTKRAIPAWRALGFRKNRARDPKMTGNIPIRDNGAVCLDWPDTKVFPSPTECWRRSKFRKA